MKSITLKTLLNNLLLATGIILSPTLFAQGVYLDINTGYALPIAGQSMSYNSNSTQTINEQTDEYSETQTSSSTNISMGKGLNFGMNMGYMFNKNIGFDLGLSYLTGGKTESEHITTMNYTDFTGAQSTSVEEYQNTFSSQMLHITPSIVLSTGFEKLNPYAKLGAIVSFGTIKSESVYTDDFYGESSKYAQELSGGFGLGFSGTFGATYPLNEKLGLFGELNFISMSYTPTESEITAFEINGYDELGSLTTRDKYTVFEKEVTRVYDKNNQPSETEPGVSTQFSFPASSMGFNLGIRFNL